MALALVGLLWTRMEPIPASPPRLAQASPAPSTSGWTPLEAALARAVSAEGPTRVEFIITSHRGNHYAVTEFDEYPSPGPPQGLHHFRLWQYSNKSQKWYCKCRCTPGVTGPPDVEALARGVHFPPAAVRRLGEILTRKDEEARYFNFPARTP